ncbi:response regulator [Patescibacteria group bacterium]|nr:response regulator [Patescibacteria group bacterium]
MAKILLVEDDQFLRKVYLFKLSKQPGWEIVVAVDGIEAVDKAVSERPDLIILDLILPGQDGFAVLKVLKEKEETKNVPVIITSALGQGDDVKQGMELGAVDYLVKSNTSLDGIIDKVSQHLPGVVATTDATQTPDATLAPPAVPESSAAPLTHEATVPPVTSTAPPSVEGEQTA